MQSGRALSERHNIYFPRVWMQQNNINRFSIVCAGIREWINCRQVKLRHDGITVFAFRKHKTRYTSTIGVTLCATKPLFLFVKSGIMGMISKTNLTGERLGSFYSSGDKPISAFQLQVASRGNDSEHREDVITLIAKTLFGRLSAQRPSSSHQKSLCYIYISQVATMMLSMITRSSTCSRSFRSAYVWAATRNHRILATTMNISCRLGRYT